MDGKVSLKEKALAEQLHPVLCIRLKKQLQASQRSQRQVYDDLTDKLADKYFCNFSVFQSLPDTWAINKRFIMLAINRWNDTYERVLLGGMTCDSDDYYNSEQNMNAIYLPKYNKEKPLYIGFFNTGAYQETIGGYGGLHHCLIPQPKHILIDRDENGILATEIFSEQQTADDVLKILGYAKK